MDAGPQVSDNKIVLVVNQQGDNERVRTSTGLDSIDLSSGARRRQTPTPTAAPANGTRAAPTYEYRSFPVCGDNETFTPEGGNRCGLVALCPQPDDILYAVQRRPAGSDGAWASLPPQCIGPGEAVDVPAPLTVADVIEAEFRNLPLPAIPTQVQPAGRALVNMPTIFYVDPAPQVYDVVLLGQPVRVTATPAQYLWTFGDGDSLGPTTSPGAPYPDHDITHTYVTADPFQAEVAVTYAGTYSVAGGPDLDIPGTVTIEGPPVDLDIVEARSELIANP